MAMAFRQIVQCVPEDDPNYRWLLEVQIAPEDASGPCLVVILMNPSTANVDRSDPTVGKVEAWARRENFARIVYLNLFARRGTHPADLAALPYDELVGEECDEYITLGLSRAVGPADKIVIACGDSPSGWDEEVYRKRLREVQTLIGNRPVYSVGPLTQRMYPRHGLMWNNTPTASSYTWQALRR